MEPAQERRDKRVPLCLVFVLEHSHTRQAYRRSVDYTNARVPRDLFDFWINSPPHKRELRANKGAYETMAPAARNGIKGNIIKRKNKRPHATARYIDIRYRLCRSIELSTCKKVALLSVTVGKTYPENVAVNAGFGHQNEYGPRFDGSNFPQ